jgi:carbonic anhydrase/acetyltransferase-like protein (isoleucine patch superfamily)
MYLIRNVTNARDKSNDKTIIGNSGTVGAGVGLPGALVGDCVFIGVVVAAGVGEGATKGGRLFRFTGLING